MVKLKRKLAGLNEFNTFQSYIDYLNNRVEFTDTNESIIQIDKNELIECYKKFESYFDLIKPLTVSLISLNIDTLVKKLSLKI